MNSPELDRTEGKSLRANDVYTLEINLGQVFIFFTLVYAVLFSGGIETFYWNSPKKMYLLSIFSFVAPSVICFYLYRWYAEKALKFVFGNSFLIKLLITAVLIAIYTFINYYNKFNLQCDEVGYAQMSQKLPSVIYELILSRFNLVPFPVPVSFLLQVMSLMLWGLLFAAFYFITKTKAKAKIRLVVILALVCLFRVFAPYWIGASLTHPPLIYFITGIASVFTGVNDKTFELSMLLLFVMFFGYLLYRIKMPFVIYLCLVISVLSIPAIGYWTYIYEQAIFAFFCFSIVIIEIYLDETEPVYLVGFVAIAVLFRQSCVVAFLALVPYTIHYLNKKNIKIISKQAFYEFMPALFMLPTFLYALWRGTPTTPALLDGYSGAKVSLIDKLLHLDLVMAFYDVFSLYVLVIALGTGLLIYRKKYLVILSICLMCFSYLFLHLIGNMPRFDPKYYLEAYGFILVLSILIFWGFIQQSANGNVFAICLTFLFLGYKGSQGQKAIGMNVWPRDKTSVLKGHENHFSYVYEYIKRNQIYDRSIVLGIDYGVFPFILNNITNRNLEAIEKNRTQYFKEKKGGWLDIDATCLQNKDSIEYIFINDYLDTYGNNPTAIDTLTSVYGWRVIMNIPVTESTTGCIGLKRNR